MVQTKQHKTMNSEQFALYRKMVVGPRALRDAAHAASDKARRKTKKKAFEKYEKAREKYEATCKAADEQYDVEYREASDVCSADEDAMKEAAFKI